MFSTALIQSPFVYGRSSWFLLLQKKLKNKLKRDQNKHIRFYSNLLPRLRIDPSLFRKIQWLPASDRVEHCIVNTVFKYWNGTVSGYIHEMFNLTICRCSTKSRMELDLLLRKTDTGQKSLSI